MTVNYNPLAVTDGLVLCLDPANVKGYDEYENLVSYSTYSALTWSNIFPANATLTTGISAPDGTNTAVRLTCSTTGSSLLRVSFPVFTPNGTDQYTTSFYVRLISGSTSSSNLLTTDLADGSPSGNYLPNLITNTWVRVSFSGIPTATAKSFIDLLSDNTNNYVLDFWGVQVERGGSVNDYYSTNGTVKNRGTGLIDLTGNSYNATLQNGVFYDTRNNGYLIFDGANDYAELSSNPNTFTSYSQQITVEVWLYVNPSASFSNVIGIVSRGTAGDTYGLRFTGSVVGSNPIVSSYFSSTATGDVCESVGNIPKGVWKQLNAVWTGSSSILYINGDLIQTSSSPVITGSVSTGTNYNIGREPFVTSYFNGNMSAIKIYNKALTASEIRQNFNALRGRFGI